MDERNEAVVPGLPGLEKRQYTPAERALAWLAIPAGYFFCTAAPGEKPLTATVYALVLMGVTLPLLARGRRFTAPAAVSFAAAFLAALSLPFCGDAFLRLCGFGLAAAAYCYGVYCLCGGRLSGEAVDLMLPDLRRTLFRFPFGSYGKLFPAMGQGGGQARRRALLRALGGAALAVIPTVIVVKLLRFDSGFSALIDRLFRSSDRDWGTFLLRLMGGILLGMYLFGLYASATGDRFAAENREFYLTRRFLCRRLPLLTAICAVLPVLVVYVLFFFSQWDYFTGAFTGVLPRGFSYADYAREGFFELCAVAGINFLLLMGLDAYTRREKRAEEGVLKLLKLLLCLFSLVLIATAAAKLVLYIRRYGLTDLRVYAAWFMAVLTVWFLLMLAGIFAPALPVRRLGVAVGTVLLLALLFSGSTRFIARYNTDRYLDGTLSHADVDHYTYLGEDAVPEMIRLAEAMAEKEGTTLPELRRQVTDKFWSPDSTDLERLICELNRQADLAAYREKENSLWYFTFPRHRAEKALAAAGWKLYGNGG